MKYKVVITKSAQAGKPGMFVESKVLWIYHSKKEKLFCKTCFSKELAKVGKNYIG